MTLANRIDVALHAIRAAFPSTPAPSLDAAWMLSVVWAWRQHWEGSDHRYGQDFAAFLGERLMTDFHLREHEPYPFGHARLSSEPSVPVETEG